MAITVRFPAMLHARAGRQLVIDEPVDTVGALVAALERQQPQLALALADPILNVAVNGEMLLHGVSTYALHDGDEVEFVPAIAGGHPRITRITRITQETRRTRLATPDPD
jgi:molybdopterin converting factor small subunit